MSKFQSAAIPFRMNADNQIEILLVTSRRRGRWVLPKGKIKQGMPCYESAAHEAFEEAGVLGQIIKARVGTYVQYKRFQELRKSVEIRIHAYPLHVEVELRTWPEMNLRKRQWLPVREAASIVADRNLQAVIHQFEAQYAEHGLNNWAVAKDHECARLQAPLATLASRSECQVEISGEESFALIVS